MGTDHSEYCYNASDSDTVVVFIHGLLGSPLQFTYLIDKLSGMYSVVNLLLPGHGETICEFASSSMSEWQDYLDSRIRLLESRYQNIILVAHSMGGLLCVNTALSCPDKIRGLFLLAIPLVIHVKSPYVKTRMLSVLDKDYTENVAKAAKSSNSVRVTSRLRAVTALPRFIELLAKSRQTRKQIDKLQLPVLVVQSENDETVSIKSLRYFDRMPNVGTMTAVNAGHFYYPQPTKEMLAEALLHFIARVLAALPADAETNTIAKD